MKTENEIAKEIQKQIRSLSDGRIDYIVRPHLSIGTYYITEECDRSGIHLMHATREEIITWCKQDILNRFG